MAKSDLWEYKLREEDQGKKYEEILVRKFHFSRKLIQQLKLGQKVWVNGRFSYLNSRGETGEILAVELCSSEEPTIPGEDLSLQLLFEDEYIMAVNKPAGQVVHPTPRYPHGTVGNAVVGYWERNGETHPFRPVHRIDRNTSGVVIIAKNRFAHQQLAWQLQHQKICKRYIGIVSGIIQEDTGIVNGPISLAPGSYIKRQVTSEGLPAITHYHTLKRYSKATLLEFLLDTGRTHQIRVHCQTLGHPLLGDDLYEGDASLISRQALHSLSYSFSHPASGKYITIKAPLPEDLQKLLRLIENMTAPSNSIN